MPGDRENEWQDIYDQPFGQGQVRFRCYIERHRGSRDQVVVHTYTNLDGDDATAQEHSVWRFWLIDEDDQIAKYKTTRGKSEPSDMALFGLQEYGYDCDNFDMVTEEEREADEAESYSRLAEEFLRRAGSVKDPAREDLLVELYVRAELYSKLTDPAGGGNDVLDIIYGRETDAEMGDLEIEIPGFIPTQEQPGLSEAIVERFTELMKHYSEGDWHVSDERTIRR